MSIWSSWTLRWRPAMLFFVGGPAVLAVGGAKYGRASAGYLAPIVLAIAAGLYLLAGLRLCACSGRQRVQV